MSNASVAAARTSFSDLIDRAAAFDDAMADEGSDISRAQVTANLGWV